MLFRRGYEPNPWADIEPHGSVVEIDRESVAFVGGIALWLTGIGVIIALACGVLGLFGQIVAAIVVGAALLSRG